MVRSSGWWQSTYVEYISRPFNPQHCVNQLQSLRSKRKEVTILLFKYENIEKIWKVEIIC